MDDDFLAPYRARDRVLRLMGAATEHNLLDADLDALAEVVAGFEEHLASRGELEQFDKLRDARRRVEHGNEGTPRQRMWRELTKLGWARVSPEEKRERMLEDFWRLTDPDQYKWPGRKADGVLTAAGAEESQRVEGGPWSPPAAAGFIRWAYGVASLPAALEQLAEAKRELSREIQESGIELEEERRMLAAPVPRRAR